MWYTAKNTKHCHAWERSYLLEFAMGCPAGMGELLQTTEWEEIAQCPLGPIDLLQARTIETLYTWDGISTIKRGKKKSIPVLLQSISSCLTMLSAPVNMYGRHNQLTFPRLPTYLSLRPGGHVLFSTIIIYSPSLSPPLAWRHLIYVEDLMTFKW